MGLGGAISDLISQAVKTAQGGSAADGGPSSQAQGPDVSRRGRIVKSGAGLAIACVVIFVFIIAASFLKSVLFGLILAYFILPLEKSFEGFLKKPWLSFLKPKPKSGSDADAAANESLALRASLLSLGSLSLGILLVLSLAVFIALPSISGAGAKIKGWAASNETFKRVETQVKNELGIAAPAPSEGVKAAHGRIESLATWTTAQLESLLAEKESQQALANLTIDGGQRLVYSATAITKFLAKFIFDLLLTFFFLFYFLQKMAVFESSSGVGDGRLSAGSWIVKGIFDSSWMPETGAEARAEAAGVIDRICLMLRAWVRGYLSIIILESVLYIACFLLFDVPYALPLGIVAGCTILLPFIGPVASGALTLCICLGTGDGASLLTVIGVLATYIIIHGAVEQLFLYPRLVGESIGLTSLETIIVVLLGGLFAGVSGMIFAVPAASVLKYLIPTVYHCWFPSQPKQGA